jgi:photosystem II stability/assembly factor-like uncharacterized protein
VEIWFCRLVLNVFATAKRSAVLAALLPFLCAPVKSQEQWTTQFFYDQSDSSFDLADLQCPTVDRCVAAGVITDKNDHQKGTVVVTRDGGLHWSLVDVKEHPTSLFFLDDSQGWMVTDHGIWATNEGGQTWNKLQSLKDIVRVYFLNPMRGYAIGSHKAVYETVNGGKKWTKLAAASEPASDAKHTVYNWISFLGQHGIIVGTVQRDEPEQAAGEAAYSRPEQNSTTVILETLDGGKTWKSRSETLFGTITRSRMTNRGFFLLIEYYGTYTLPSSLVRWPPGAKTFETVFAERNRAVTDFALFPNGEAILAAVEPPGSSNQIPIPGKLKMLQSSDLKAWREMDVDYRAVAQRAVLSAVDAQHVWVATDTGMILRLTSHSAPSARR